MTDTMMVAAHGGTDAMGAAQWDFSTNSNAAGPCPYTLEALQVADATRYPDPTYQRLREQLAEFHDVDVLRIVIGASASELIARLAAWTALRHPRGTSWMPQFHYGDYAVASTKVGLKRTDRVDEADLIWLCAPSSPLGQALTLPEDWDLRKPGTTVVLDCAYAPLQLSFKPIAPELDRDAVWQLWTPNKALGLCGIRGAYAIAPQHADRSPIAEFAQLGSSWPTGAHGVALLESWCSPMTQRWMNEARHTLRGWKLQQMARLQMLGWEGIPSETNFGVMRLPWPLLLFDHPDMPGGRGEPAQPRCDARGGWDGMQADASALRVLSPYWHSLTQALRARGVKLRDCCSFGLPGHVRLCVHTPEAQQALVHAWTEVTQELKA